MYDNRYRVSNCAKDVDCVVWVGVRMENCAIYLIRNMMVSMRRFLRVTLL